MDINAKFSADFTEFNTGVVAAEEKLKSIEGESSKVAEAIGKIPPALNETNTAAGGAAAGTNTLAGSLGQVDKVLGLAGINIGKTVGALKELGGVAGKTAGEVGLLGTGLASVGAFLIGWNIGRPIAAFFDLDKKIGDATARLLGFGDVAAQVAGAQMDELARASQRAGRAVTDLAEARRINAGQVAKDQEAAKKAKEAYDDWADATKRLDDISYNWQKDLQTINGTTLQGAEAALAHGASVRDVALSYGLTIKQVNAMVAAMADAKTKADAYAETVKKIQAIETSQLTGRIVGLNELGRIEEVQSDARIQRAIKEVKAFEDAMTAQADIAKKANAARAGAGAVEDPILKAALARDQAIADVNKRWPQGGDEASAIMEDAANKFQDAVNQITGANKPGGFMAGQLPFSQLAATPVTVNVSGVLDPRTIDELTQAVADKLVRSSARQFGSR